MSSNSTPSSRCRLHHGADQSPGLPDDFGHRLERWICSTEVYFRVDPVEKLEVLAAKLPPTITGGASAGTRPFLLSSQVGLHDVQRFLDHHYLSYGHPSHLRT